MNLDKIKSDIAAEVYHVPSNKKIPLHKHPDHDEIFYCIKGFGYGILEKSGVSLSAGETFIVRAGTMHSLTTDGDLYVASFLVPVK